MCSGLGCAIRACPSGCALGTSTGNYVMTFSCAIICSPRRKSPAASQASVVSEFIHAALKEIAMRHNASQIMVTDEDMAGIHRDLCENIPRSWSACYPSHPADGQRQPKAERAAKSRATASAKQITKKQQIRVACDRAEIKLCTRFNLGEQCSRPFDPATDTCTHTAKGGQVLTLSHTCAQRTATGRCGQKHVTM